MKKIIFLFLALIFFTGCATYFYYDYEELKDNVVSAKIVDVSYINDEINLITIKEIETNKYNELFGDLSKIKIRNVTGNPRSPIGACLQLIYNGYYEIVYNHVIVSFKNTGEYIKGKNIGISSITYSDFINKYKE